VHDGISVAVGSSVVKSVVTLKKKFENFNPSNMKIVGISFFKEMLAKT
jgi:hypothetical protein